MTTHSLQSYAVALWQCWRLVTPSTATKLWRLMVFPVVSVWVLLAAALIFMNVGDVENDSTWQPHRASLASFLSKTFDTSPSPSNKDIPRQPLQGMRVAVVGGDNTHKIHALLLQHKAILSAPNHADIVLQATSQGWRFSTSDPSVAIWVIGDIYNVLQEAQNTRYDAAQWRRVKMGAPWEKSKEEIAQTAERNIVAMLIVRYLIIAPLLLVLGLVAGGMCFDIEQLREKGTLEPFVLAHMPFWVMLLGMSLARATVAASTTLVLLVGLFVLLPTWLWGNILFIAVGMFAATSAFSMVGSFQVLFFHHRWSRIVGGLLFNPTAMFLPAVVLLVDDEFVFPTVSNSAHLLSNLPLLSTSYLTMAAWAAMVVLNSVGVVVCMCWAVEKRLGPRRRGLAAV